MADVPVYHGKFGEREATRLLWRAGFGPRPGEARKLARRFNLRGAVRSLTRPRGRERLSGPEPVDGDGLPLAPFDAYGHDLLWWLDRMVRTNHPTVERMALIWHDWFATADVDSQRLSIGQAQLFERRGLGSFGDLLLDVTTDPAMLIWLSGVDNEAEAPNENYGREMMELFTLGASNEAGYPYSETDVREQARALTGWTAEWVDDVGYTNFRFDPERHDGGPKTVFGRSGTFNWSDSCRLCISHPAHKTFFVTKLWSYFIPTPPSRRTRKALEHLYVKREHAIRPVLEAILMHPDFYRGPAMVKSPVVYIAGLLRARAPGRSQRLVVDLRARRPAALPAPERRRLGRGSLARHLDLPRPVDGRERDRRLRRARRRGQLRRGRGAEDGGAQGRAILGRAAAAHRDPQGA